MTTQTRPTPAEVIVNFTDEVYHPDVFPPVDLSAVRAILEREGFTLDRVSAQIIRRIYRAAATNVVEALSEHGYFIVHRDDVPGFPDPKECPVCSEWFTYQTGQSTGKRHRSDAIYCSKKCADRASYLRRKAAPPRREMNA